MFKNLGKRFENKKVFLDKSLDKSQRIKKEVGAFLKDVFGDKLKGFSFLVSYNSKDDSLVITTANKILANELSIRLIDLSNLLKTKDIRLGKILIK